MQSVRCAVYDVRCAVCDVQAVCTSEAWRSRQRRTRLPPGGHGEAREQRGSLGRVETEEGTQLGEGCLIEADLAAALAAAALAAAAERHGLGA